VLQCVTVCYSVLQCVAVCFSVLHCDVWTTHMSDCHCVSFVGLFGCQFCFDVYRSLLLISFHAYRPLLYLSFVHPFWCVLGSIAFYASLDFWSLLFVSFDVYRSLLMCIGLYCIVRLFACFGLFCWFVLMCIGLFCISLLMCIWLYCILRLFGFLVSFVGPFWCV